MIMETKVNYTLRKDWPLTDDQNEIIDYMIHRNKAVCAAQTGFRAEKLILCLQLYVIYYLNIIILML